MVVKRDPIQPPQVIIPLPSVIEVEHLPWCDCMQCRHVRYGGFDPADAVTSDMTTVNVLPEPDNYVSNGNKKSGTPIRDASDLLSGVLNAINDALDGGMPPVGGSNPDDVDDEPASEPIASDPYAGRQREKIVSDRGHVTMTPLTDSEAAEIIRKNKGKDKFADKLLAEYDKYKRLFTNKRCWLHQKAIDFAKIDAAPGAGSTQPAGTYAKLYAHFRASSVHIGRPEITFSHQGKKILRISLSTKGREPGSLLVTDGGKYGASTFFGRIRPDGSFQGSGNQMSGNVSAIMDALAREPVGFMAAYGQASMLCCFCGADLTDPRSRSKGYGPTCARNWSLPW